MKFPHGFGEEFQLAQQAGGQQIGLRVKGPTFQTWVVTFRHHAL
jgi:hypothetical protein